MCLQTVRRHMCRHCSSEWTHADGLELCPEGEKVVSKHGYCAPVVELLENGGHHVSVGRVVIPPHQGGGGHHLLLQQPPPQQQQQVSHGSHMYPLTHQQIQRNIVANAGILEDMCEDCKDKHYREWAIEARARQAQLAG